MGSVNWRSSAWGRAGAKLIDTALVAAHVSVVSCPATTVWGLVLREIVGGETDVGTGGGGGTGGTDWVGAGPPPASCELKLEPAPPHPAQSAIQTTTVKLMRKLRILELPWPITTPCST